MIFSVDNSSSLHTDKREEFILVRLHDTANGLDDNAITGEAKYLVNITRSMQAIVFVA